MSSSACVIGADFFSVEEEEAQETSLPPCLSWRGDAIQTHSDWTIVVQVQEKDNSKEVEETRYPVHKNILSVGARSSTYFATLFSSHNFKEQADGGVSRIVLEKQDAQVFEIMLDFIYDGTLVAACTENAVALRSLARYFCCPSLLKAINAFIQQDLSVETAPLYLVQAYERSDVKLVSSTQNLIIQYFEELDEHALDHLPIKLFSEIWNSQQSDNHARASRMAYYYFQAHPQARTASLLCEFTSSLKIMDVTVVSGFLELVAQLPPSETESEAWLALDGLCKKCASSIVQDWRLFDTELCVRKFLNPSLEGDFRGTGRIAVRLMGAGIEQAKQDYTRVLEKTHSLQALQERLSIQLKAQEERISSLEESCRYKDLEIKGLQIGMDRSKKRAAADLQKSQERVAQLEHKAKELQEELANLTKTTPKKRVGWSP